MMKLEMKYYKKVWAEVEDGGSGQWLPRQIHIKITNLKLQ
jgi:hypothetical protein